MAGELKSKLAALSVCGMLGAMLMPSCDQLGGEGGGGGAREQAAIETLATVDPNQFARTEVTGEYAAYVLAGLIQSDVADPSALDEATANALIDQHLQDAWSQARAWAQGLDASMLSVPPTPKKECVTKYGYEESVGCYFKDNLPNAECIVTACGTGACPTCPSLFNLDKLIVKSWAVHTCVRDGSIIGVRITLKIALLQELYRCIKLEKPVP